MTKKEFILLCEKYAVHPSVALENNGITEALLCKDANTVEEILRNEF